jgi:cytochrome c oxidase cbb3-type subunit 4
MPDLGSLRGVITVVTLAVFLGICWWAYRPSSRQRFEDDALLPFEDESEGSGRERSLSEADEKELS